MRSLVKARLAAQSLIAFCCALSLSGCAGVDGGTKFQVSLSKVQLTGCPTSASPLPGWRNCTGVITLSVTGVPSSGYLSTYMDYGSSGTFYHGQVAVVDGTTTATVNVVAEYVSTCLTSVSTTVDVYDGPQSNQNAPLIGSYPITLTGTC